MPVLKALRRKPVVDFLARLILGYAVALLDLAFELFTAAIDGSQVIGGELAPLRLDLTLQVP